MGAVSLSRFCLKHLLAHDSIDNIDNHLEGPEEDGRN